MVFSREGDPILSGNEKIYIYFKIYIKIKNKYKNVLNKTFIRKKMKNLIITWKTEGIFFCQLPPSSSSGLSIASSFVTSLYRLLQEVCRGPSIVVIIFFFFFVVFSDIIVFLIFLPNQAQPNLIPGILDSSFDGWEGLPISPSVQD